MSKEPSYKHLFFSRFSTFFYFFISVIPLFAQTASKITFPVTVEGEMLNHPFAGGMDAPQFSNVDLNHDGIPDLFVFDRVGDVVNTYLKDPDLGFSEDFIYAPEYEKIFPKMKEWAILHDFDQDGIEDLFTSSQTGVAGIVVYKGEIDNDQLTFEPFVTGQGNHRNLYFQNNGNWTNIYVAFSDIPALTDVDGDGDMDILNFDTGGSYVFFYKNQSIEKGYGLDSLDFILQDICWGKFQESGFNELLYISEDCESCADRDFDGDNPFRHAGSTLLALDRDGDGDQDLVIGDLSSRKLVEVRNTGNEDEACVEEVITDFPPEDAAVDIPIFISPFYEDINGDGLRDLIASVNNISGSESVEVAWYYENIGEDNAPVFELRNKHFLGDQMIDGSRRAYPTTIDYNVDGLVDIVVGTFGYYLEGGGEDARLLLFENKGTHTEPAFELVDDDYANFSSFNDEFYSFAPTFGDLDNDGDNDLLVGEFFGSLIYAENIAGPGQTLEFASPKTDWLGIDVGSLSTPQIFDLNRDGKMDIIVGEKNNNMINNESCGNINYFENVGELGNPAFINDPKTFPNTECLGNVSSFYPFNIRGDASPYFYTFPNGPSLLLGSHEGYFSLYNNIEDNLYGEFNLVEEKLFGIREGNQTHGEFADLNGDGYYELIVGNFRGGISMFSTSIKFNNSPVKEELEQVNVKISPNPAMDKLRIDSDLFMKSIRLLDLYGREMMYQQAMNRHVIIDLKDYISGTYVLEIKHKDIVIRKRIIIQH